MSATNHTTNYSLSQFAQTDKPAWLGDYNQDMTKIDTAMKANADSVSTLGTTVAGHTSAISANTSDIATAQSDISSLGTRMTAVETKNSEQDTAITNAQNKADTADGKADTNATNIASQALDIASLQSESQSQDAAITTNATNITNVSNSLNAFKTSMTLSNFTNTTNIGNQFSQVNINLAQSADSAIFKVYGGYWIATSGSAVTIALSAITGLSGYYGTKTTLKLTTPPTESYIIDGADNITIRSASGSSINVECYVRAIAVDTDGYIWLNVRTSNTITVGTYTAQMNYLPPCVYFNTNFGDTPQPD